ncbi:MAG TPA: hypothetical protein PLQ93_07870 [Bacteroidia bacterium]|nr:hypothetical protein [Bacteroidia bacterium]
MACTDTKHDTGPEEAILQKEIDSRLKSFDSLSNELKSIGIDPTAIHLEIAQLLLVSKDVENLGASVSMSNTYFEKLADKHQFNQSMIVKLNREMAPEDISLALKQNELVVLNQIFLQKLQGHVDLKPAY